MAAEQPSPLSIGIASGIIGVTIGYLLGTGSYLGLWGSNSNNNHNSKTKQPKKSWPNNYDVTIHPDSSDEELMAALKVAGQDSEDSNDDEEGPAGDLAEFMDNREECKLVLVVRNDLGMGKGLFCYRFRGIRK